MKKIFLFAAGAAILVGAGVAVVSWYRSSKETPEFETATVQRGDIKATILTTGTAKPQNRLEIKPPIAGRVEEVLVSEGAHLRSGEIIAWLSSTERAALLDAARAKGSTELAYWEDLYKPTPLIAPIDGDIIARNVEPGQTVTAQDVLLVMSDRLIIEAQLDETDIGRVAKDQRAEIRMDAYPDQVLTGRVDHIAYEAETINNVTMYMVDVLPDRIPPFLRSGMTANISLIMTETNNTLILPADAVLVNERGRSAVRVRSTDNGSKTPWREVETGISDGRNIEIKSGLNEGDVVMLKAFEAFHDTKENERRNPLVPSPPRRR